MSHSAEKCKRGTIWDLLTYIQLQNVKELEEGTLWGHLKFLEKKSHSAEKIERGTVRFCRLRLKSKKARGGTLWNNLDAFPGYSFSFFS